MTHRVLLVCPELRRLMSNIVAFNHINNLFADIGCLVGDLLNLEILRDSIQGEAEIAGPLAQLLIARSLERIGDQATNIGEEIVYMIDGADIRHKKLQARLGRSFGVESQTTAVPRAGR